MKKVLPHLPQTSIRLTDRANPGIFWLQTTAYKYCSQTHPCSTSTPNIIWQLGSAFGGSGRQKRGNEGREGRGGKRKERKEREAAHFKNRHLWFLSTKTVQSYSPESVSAPSSRPLTAVRKLPMSRWNVCLL